MNESLRLQCNRLLASLLGEEHTEQWWDSPNKHFNGETPRKIFDSEPNLVYNYLLEHAEGHW